MDVLKAMLDQLKLRTRNDLIHGLALPKEKLKAKSEEVKVEPNSNA